MKPFNTPAPWLAPIRASHLIELDFYTGERNLVHVWLPEDYGEDPFRTGVLDRTEDRRFKMEGDTLVSTFDAPGLLSLRATVDPLEDGIAMSLSITNHSQQTLPAAVANVCVQFASAPTFRDTLLERYFYVSGGAITYFKRPYYNYEDNHVWFYGHAPDERFLHNPEPDLGFIGLASHDGKYVAGMGWDSTRILIGNCHGSIACIHADPYLRDIAPLATGSTRGVLYLMKGKPKDCVGRFKAEFMK
jgi:hypothetical protein